MRGETGHRHLLMACPVVTDHQAARHFRGAERDLLLTVQGEKP